MKTASKKFLTFLLVLLTVWLSVSSATAMTLTMTCEHEAAVLQFAGQADHSHHNPSAGGDVCHDVDCQDMANCSMCSVCNAVLSTALSMRFVTLHVSRTDSLRHFLLTSNPDTFFRPPRA
ncbi:MAG: hypothetical protein KDJ38_19885 [Gammaproteobacteria bacterium]|nr:hypothetical protein [Gammaproteobacteria bacterium]